MCTIREFLHDENLKEETRNQLAFLNTCQKKRKSKRKSKMIEEKHGNEVDSTGSFMSNLSITQSEDDFLDIEKPFKKHHKSNLEGSFVGAKRSRISCEKRRSSANSKFMTFYRQLLVH